MKQVTYFKLERKSEMKKTIFACNIEDGNLSQSLVVGGNSNAMNSIESFPFLFPTDSVNNGWVKIEPKEFFDNSDAAKKLLQMMENDAIDHTDVKERVFGKPSEFPVKSKMHIEDDLIDALAQMYFLSKTSPSREISLAITKLQETLSWFTMPPIQF